MYYKSLPTILCVNLKDLNLNGLESGRGGIIQHKLKKIASDLQSPYGMRFRPHTLVVRLYRTGNFLQKVLRYYSGTT